MRRYLICLLTLAMGVGFALSAVAQRVGVDENDYPHWQITGREPSVAFARFSGLEERETYVYTVRMYLEPGEYAGQVYNPAARAWIATHEVARLPEFTAISGEAAFFVPYRCHPGMREGDGWRLSINVALKEVALEGGDFSPDLSLPLILGSTAPGPFGMGFIEGVETTGRAEKIASPGPARALLARRSPPLGMYISEDNGIEEGYEEVPEGFFRFAVPARGSLKDDPEILDYALEVRDPETNRFLTLVQTRAPVPEPGDITAVQIWVTEINAAASDGASEIPDAYGLSQNYPNPANPSTQIDFQLLQAGSIQLTISIPLDSGSGYWQKQNWTRDTIRPCGTERTMPGRWLRVGFIYIPWKLASLRRQGA